MNLRFTFSLLFASALVVSRATSADAPGISPDAKDVIKEAVLSANAAMIAAANRLDTDAFFAQIVDGEAVPVVQNGVLFGSRAKAKEAVERGLRGIYRIERRIDHPQVTVLGPDAALLVGEGSVTATGADGREMTSTFAVSLVFVRRKAEWKLLHGHYSTVPRS